MNKQLYRISYRHHDEIYEIYAKHIEDSDMFGFIEVEDLVFGESSSDTLEPAEKRFRDEFTDVKTTFLPSHNIIRIDLVEKLGPAKIVGINAEKQDNSQEKHATEAEKQSKEGLPHFVPSTDLECKE